MTPEDLKTIEEAISAAIHEYPSAHTDEVWRKFNDALALLRAEPEAREPKVMPTYLSRDYEALYELLFKGGEALGTCLDLDEEERVGSIFSDAEIVDGKEHFLSECQRLQLEWVAPLDRSRMIEAVKDAEVFAACETYADNYMIEGRITTSPKAMRKALENFLKYRK